MVIPEAKDPDALEGVNFDVARQVEKTEVA